MLSEKFLSQIDSYIVAHREELERRRELKRRRSLNRRDVILSCKKYRVSTSSVAYYSIVPPQKKLDDRLQQVSETFPQYLLNFIAERGLDEVEVYKRAHIDRRLFSKLRNVKDYMPSKRTVLLIAFAMKLDLTDAENLLWHAGYNFSEHSIKDVIIKFFFENEIYDLFTLNEALDHYGFKTLF